MSVDLAPTEVVMGEEHAAPDFESWVKASGGALLKFAYLITGDRERAADAVQDALVAACPRWQRIIAGGDPGAYLRRCVVNADTSRWRRFLRRETPMADVPEPETVANGDPAHRVTVEDTAWTLCSRLPTKQRAAVVLRFYEGRTDDEIAATLDCTVSTVRSQIHRALATLRGQLRAEEVEQA